MGAMRFYAIEERLGGGGKRTNKIERRGWKDSQNLLKKVWSPQIGSPERGNKRQYGLSFDGKREARRGKKKGVQYKREGTTCRIKGGGKSRAVVKWS